MKEPLFDNPDTENIAQTLPHMILSGKYRYREHSVCRTKTSGSYHDITWTDFSKELFAYTYGLLSLDFRKGDRAAIMSPNGPQWVWADFAIQASGGICVPIYHTESHKNMLYILKNSGCRVLFIHSPLVIQKVIESLKELPDLDKIILLRGTYDHDKVIALTDFLNSSRENAEQELQQRLSQLKPDDLASIVYTSGTTGPPKGAMLTHGNFLSNLHDCAKLFDLGPTDTCLSFLPLSHVFERTAGYYLMLSRGVTIAYAESIDTVPANMTETKPTVMISVPRLYEKMYARVMDKVVSGPWLKRNIFMRSVELCKQRLSYDLSKRKPPSWLKVLTSLIHKKVFEKLRTPLGGRIRYFVSGGAPLAKNVAEFFNAAGIPIYEGYGLTETSPVVAANTNLQIRLGSVGKPLPNTKVKIADDGEILVSGPGVFHGYWNDHEQTDKAIKDGWFHTGDVGEIDNDGFLKITDRKKDLIVTAGGENIAPQILEKLFKTDKFIANALVYGDRRPFLTALLIPNFDNLVRYANMKGIEFLTHCDLVLHPQILSLMRRRLEKLQKGQPGFMHIKRFTLLSRDFLVENDELTQTLKIKRKVVAKKFNQIVDRMYLAKDHGIHDHGFCIITEND